MLRKRGPINRPSTLLRLASVLPQRLASARARAASSLRLALSVDRPYEGMPNCEADNEHVSNNVDPLFGTRQR